MDELKNITIRKGSTFDRTVTARDASKNPLDLTGLTVTSHLRKLTGELINAITITPDPDQVTNPGVFRLSLTAAVTAGFEVCPGELDVEITDGLGSVFASGKVAVKIKERVTGRS